MNKKKLLEISGTLTDLPNISKKISTLLLKDQKFCLWLQGDLGAGKTTFTGYLLRSIGLPDIIPVTSPTFAYINEYEINQMLYAHLDLYRIESDTFNSEDLGINEERDFRGIFVEWPEKITDKHDLMPTHLLEISASDDLSTRTYRLYKLGF